MKKPMFSVYDNRAQVFAAPFVSVNQATAMRDFHAACNDTTSQLHNYPNDFALYEIAQFDDSNGCVEPHTTPQNLGLAAAFNDKIYKNEVDQISKEA